MGWDISWENINWNADLMKKIALNNDKAWKERNYDKIRYHQIIGICISNVTKRECRGGQSHQITFSVMNKERKCIEVTYYLEKLDKKMIPERGQTVIAKGRFILDTFQRTAIQLMVDTKREDRLIIRSNKFYVVEPEENRYEIGVNTKLSDRPTTFDAAKLIDEMVLRGVKGVMVQDYNTSHSRPYIYKSLNNAKRNGADIKVVYAQEIESGLKQFQSTLTLNYDYAVLDIETTGLDIEYDSIIEIAVIRYKKGTEVSRYSTLIQYDGELSSEIQDLTHITKDMLNKDGIPLQDALNGFAEAMEGTKAIIAHNGVSFDIPFLNRVMKEQGFEPLQQKVIDTMILSQKVHPYTKKHSLKECGKRFKVVNPEAHRALTDVKTTWGVFKGLIELPLFKTQSVILSAKHDSGLTYLNQVLTDASTKNLNTQHEIKHPVYPIELYDFNRQDVMFGSPYDGEIMDFLIEGNEESAKIALSKYHYVQITSLAQYQHRYTSLATGSKLKTAINTLIELCKKNNKLIIYTDRITHWFDMDKELVGELIWNRKTQHYRNAHELRLVLSTTMNLKEDDIENVLTANPAKLFGMHDEVKVLPKDLIVPEIEGAKEMLMQLAQERYNEVYGNADITLIKERFEKEIQMVLSDGNCNIPIYYLGLEIVKYVVSNGGHVGSRGSVGSSFLAWLLGISEVNPLPAHYRCKCGFVELIEESCGLDAPDKMCRVCNKELTKDGYDIYVESFLGYERSKPADIDLNFSEKWQNAVMIYLNENYRGQVYRAGVIGAIQERRIHSRIEKKVNTILADAHTKAVGSIGTGIKTNTSQHPGGMIILPSGFDHNTLFPIQYSSHNQDKPIVSHIEYSELEENVIKLDVLGHTAPDIAEKLQRLSGINYRSVDISKVAQSFRGSELSGISEFGTAMGKTMCDVLQPSKMSDLIKMSGLAHGTGVWEGNQKILIENGVSLQELVGCRDDIMRKLTDSGISFGDAYEITDKVRKGKKLKPEQIEEVTQKCGADFMGLLSKIKYLFPKAHAVAYTIESARQMWFKMNYPAHYYAVMLTNADGGWEWNSVLNPDVRVATIEKLTKELRFAPDDEGENNAGSESDAENDEATKIESIGKKKKKLNLLILVDSMEKAGLSLERIDVKNAHATDFTVSISGRIIPPLQVINGVGKSKAEKMIENVKKGADTWEAVFDKTGITQTSKNELMKYARL